MRLIASLAVFTALFIHSPQIIAAPILGASGAVAFGSTVPAFGGGTVSYTVTNSLGMSLNSIDFITGVGAASSIPLTFAITNSSLGFPINHYTVSMSAPGTPGNLIGASITGVTLGATTSGQGFSATFGSGGVIIAGGVAPSGSPPSDFVITFSVPGSAGILAPGFSLTMTTNPEPTSLCLMGLGMAVAGGGSFWRKRRNIATAIPDAASV